MQYDRSYERRTLMLRAKAFHHHIANELIHQVRINESTEATPVWRAAGP